MSLRPFDYLLLKVAMRCNIDCTYCYWFRDESVYGKPKVLTKEAEIALLFKLEKHIVKYSLTEFSILMHGGEPLLFGMERMSSFAESLIRITERTSCNFSLTTTTNALLINQDWVDLFKKYSIDVSVSIDGPPEINDKSRIDFKGNGTSYRIEKGIRILQDNGMNPGILAVCSPNSDPKEVVEYLVNKLRIKKFDILVPDATHDDTPESISAYYIKLFDLWYYKYASSGVDIRYVKSMLKGVLGGLSKVESIGYGPINTVCMLTDGSLEPLDVIRITGNNATETSLNIFDHSFQDLVSDPLWAEVYDASLTLNTKCASCEYVQACGGGFLPHRFSKENGFDNESIYCSDLLKIFDHIWTSVKSDLLLSSGERVSHMD